MRQAERVARLARGDDRARRAAGALGVGPVRVEPQPQRHADRVRARLEQRDGAVDAAAHRDRDAARVAARRGRPARARSRARRRQRLAADGRRLEQRQPAQVLCDAGRVGVDDPVAVDAQPDERPVVAARRVSESSTMRPGYSRRKT